ncbi:MAG: TIGR03013 family XrtA/PEP-CTERM system glycosyltransferase [Acidiferrobacter sp.]
MIRIFRHYLPMRLLFLGMAEILVLWGAIYMGALFKTGPDAIFHPAVALRSKAFLFVIVMLTLMTALGLYQRDLKEGRWGHFPRLIMSLAFGFITLCVLIPFDPRFALPPVTLAYAVVAAFCGTMLTRLAYLTLASRSAVRRQILVLGTGRRARSIQALADGSLGLPGFRIVGFVPLGEQEETRGPHVLRLDGPLATLVQRRHVTEIVVGSRDRRRNLPMNDLLQCKLAGVKVVDLTTFFERESGRIELDSINPGWLVFADGFRQGAMKAAVKRVFDVVAGCLLLVVALPFMIVAVLCIKLEDGGPIFYRQERVGQNGRAFMLLKFRSMRVGAEHDGTPRWASKDDNRVTRVGGFMRKVRIDELPQAINVLRGDMSFVGPRPERPYFVQQLIAQIPYYNHRHTVKPGITGWAQVRYPYGASVEDAVEKLKYELYYVKNNSLFLDFIILFQTVQVVIFQQGSR